MDDRQDHPFPRRCQIRPCFDQLQQHVVVCQFLSLARGGRICGRIQIAQRGITLFFQARFIMPA